MRNVYFILLVFLFFGTANIALAGNYGPDPNVSYGPSRSSGVTVVQMPEVKPAQSGSLVNSGRPYTPASGTGWYGSGAGRNTYSSGAGNVSYAPLNSQR